MSEYKKVFSDYQPLSGLLLFFGKTALAGFVVMYGCEEFAERNKYQQDAIYCNNLNLSGKDLKLSHGRFNNTKTCETLIKEWEERK